MRIILAHGMMFNTRTWDRAAQELAPEVRDRLREYLAKPHQGNYLNGIRYAAAALGHPASPAPPVKVNTVGIYHPGWVITDMGGGAARRVTTSPLPGFAEYEWARARYVSFPSRIDDYTLHARILEPAALEPGRTYPVVFGPMYSNTVRNRWTGIYGLVQQLLVQKGYIVVQVDVRGSTGYGRRFREEFLTDFAGEAIEDIASAVDYVRTLPYVDPERLGIWGSSYGGTLTVYALLKKPGLFDAGVGGLHHDLEAVPELCIAVADQEPTAFQEAGGPLGGESLERRHPAAGDPCRTRAPGAPAGCRQAGTWPRRPWPGWPP